ncbi:MAG: nuclear transport factor 2 family protein [Phycisphaerales bacterium]|nr:nuclear transport factor 2 family protein [Phycisphaerales bacterium]
MAHRSTIGLAGLLVVGTAMLLGGFGMHRQPDGTSERDAVLRANSAFFEALNAMFTGDARPLEDVYWHTDDVVYMGADGAYNVGWRPTYENWKRQAALRIGGSISPSNIEVTIVGDVAMTNQIISGTNTVDHELVEVKLRSTSVLQRKDGTWKLIGHHVDVIPKLHTGKRATPTK